MDLDVDRRDGERECELDHEVCNFDLELERLLAAMLMIGDLDFRFVDDGDILFLVLDR